MKKYLFTLCTSLLMTTCSAQQVTLPEILPPPSIKVENLRNEETPVKISEVKIDIKVIGSMAVTTVDMIFFNPNDRILEGEFQFPLGEGQNISRFALDIDGKLREGVVVEKAKGQEVFESVIRQGIDPGLLEKTKGNNFRARIYPLPAKGNRRIVIAYEQELKKDKDGYLVFVPTEYNETLDRFALNALVVGDDAEPKVNNSPWGKFSFSKSNEAFVASYQAENYLAKGQLAFSIPQKKDQQVFVETGEISNETVFFSQIYPKVISQSKEEPSSIALFWDVSMSMSDRNTEMEFQLLESYLNKLGSVKIELHPFNCLPMTVKTFDIKRGNSKELIDYLCTIPHDGATQLGALDFKTVKANEILLFSDGLSNFGKTTPQTDKIPVNTISSSLKADYSLLQYIASATGGKYINLMQMEVKDAIPAMQNSSYRLISAEYNRSEIKDFTSSNGVITKNTGFSFAGKLLTNKASVTLHFGIGDKTLHTETVVIDATQKGDYDNMVERIWAEKRIAELDMLYDKNRDEIESLGRKYNIVTRNTSLIVLDRIEDYVMNNITPPAELMEQYNKMLDDRRRIDFDSKKAQIDKVISLFEKRKAWWKRSFPKNKVKPRKEEEIYLMEEAIISIADVASDDAEAIDIAELDEHRMVEQEAAPPPIQNTIRYTAPVIAADEEVAADEMVAYDMLVDTKSVKEEKISVSTSTQIRNIAKIELKRWDPDTPYLAVLKEKSNKELYDTYLELREEYLSSPSFFLDVATLFEERGLKKEALVILSNLAELEVENYRMLRVLAHRLQQLGYLEYSIGQFETVLNLRPEEPQSYRDLASVFDQNKQYQKSIDMLYKIIEKPWDWRFRSIELIAVEEMNRIIDKANREKVEISLDKVDKRLIFNMPVDVRIVLNWDTDNSDMDLWVTDPYGEKCYYANSQTRIGGIISDDFTDGYGPEEFLIKQAVDGKYKIQANYYGSREQTLLGPTTIYLDIYIRYASGEEKKETITLRLTENKEIIDIGEIVFTSK